MGRGLLVVGVRDVLMLDDGDGLSRPCDCEGLGDGIGLLHGKRDTLRTRE